MKSKFDRKQKYLLGQSGSTEPRRKTDLADPFFLGVRVKRTIQTHGFSHHLLEVPWRDRRKQRSYCPTEQGGKTDLRDPFFQLPRKIGGSIKGFVVHIRVDKWIFEIYFSSSLGKSVPAWKALLYIEDGTIDPRGPFVQAFLKNPRQHSSSCFT